MSGRSKLDVPVFILSRAWRMLYCDLFLCIPLACGLFIYCLGERSIIMLFLRFPLGPRHSARCHFLTPFLFFSLIRAIAVLVVLPSVVVGGYSSAAHSAIDSDSLPLFPSINI